MKSVFALTAVTILTMGTLFAQTPRSYRHEGVIRFPNQIMISPFYFFDGTFMLGYERLFRSGSLRITPSITLQNLDDKEYEQKEGWGLDMGYKFFFTNRPRKVNVYMGPYVIYRFLQTTNTYSSTYSPEEGVAEGGYYAKYRYKDNYDIFGFGVDGGVKFIFGRFVMDITLGGGIRYPYRNGETFESTASDAFDIDYKGIVPRGNISFGIAF